MSSDRALPHIVVHDDRGPDGAAAVVDRGLGEANAAAAPLHEVQPLTVCAHDDQGRIIGGAVGRTWGGACELQQLWVHPAWRGQGVGSALVRRFEARAIERGCTLACLDTFSFQAPRLYRALGYAAVLENAAFPHGIVKFAMQKVLSGQNRQGDAAV